MFPVYPLLAYAAALALSLLSSAGGAALVAIGLPKKVRGEREEREREREEREREKERREYLWEIEG